MRNNQLPLRQQTVSRKKLFLKGVCIISYKKVLRWAISAVVFMLCLVVILSIGSKIGLKDKLNDFFDIDKIISNKDSIELVRSSAVKQIDCSGENNIVLNPLYESTNEKTVKYKWSLVYSMNDVVDEIAITDSDVVLTDGYALNGNYLTVSPTFASTQSITNADYIYFKLTMSAVDCENVVLKFNCTNFNA